MNSDKNWLIVLAIAQENAVLLYLFSICIPLLWQTVSHEQNTVPIDYMGASIAGYPFQGACSLL